MDSSTYIWIALALSLGSSLGFLVFALMHVARSADDVSQELPPKYRLDGDTITRG